MATGQQFHKSSLLGTLAYMGSPASALRNEAASKGLTGGNLFSRDVKPLAVADNGTTANAGTVDPKTAWLQAGLMAATVKALRLLSASRPLATLPTLPLPTRPAMWFIK